MTSPIATQVCITTVVHKNLVPRPQHTFGTPRRDITFHPAGIGLGSQVQSHLSTAKLEGPARLSSSTSLVRHCNGPHRAAPHRIASHLCPLSPYRAYLQTCFLVFKRGQRIADELEQSPLLRPFLLFLVGRPVLGCLLVIRHHNPAPQLLASQQASKPAGPQEHKILRDSTQTRTRLRLLPLLNARSCIRLPGSFSGSTFDHSASSPRNIFSLSPAQACSSATRPYTQPRRLPVPIDVRAVICSTAIITYHIIIAVVSRASCNPSWSGVT